MDGVWQHDNNSPHEADWEGNINNILKVGEGDVSRDSRVGGVGVRVSVQHGATGGAGG